MRAEWDVGFLRVSHMGDTNVVDIRAAVPGTDWRTLRLSAVRSLLLLLPDWRTVNLFAALFLCRCRRAPSRPSCVLEEDLLQINLWLGAMETTTNMHYDANHNLLFVLKGSKRVALLPPDMTGGVHAMPVGGGGCPLAGSIKYSPPVSLPCDWSSRTTILFLVDFDRWERVRGQHRRILCMGTFSRIFVLRTDSFFLHWQTF